MKALKCKLSPIEKVNLTVEPPKSWNLVDGDALHRKPRLSALRLKVSKNLKMEAFKKIKKKKSGKKKKK